MADRTWNDYYSNAGSDLLQFIDELYVHSIYIDEILHLRPRRALEVGCGTGRTSVFLSYRGIDVTAIDRDEALLLKARQIARDLNGSIRLLRADAFRLPFRDSSFDVCYHQGFLEHFSDEDIRRLLSEQLRVASSVVFSVPNNHYPQREFGDERLLRRKEWEQVIRGFRIDASRNYYCPPACTLLDVLKRRRPIMYMARVAR